MKYLNYFLSLFIAGCYLLSVFSCRSVQVDTYERVFEPAEYAALAASLKDGIFNYYQGSSASQMLLQEAMQYDTTNAGIYRELAVPFLKRGFVKEYYTYYQQAVKYDPMDWQGWRGYMYLYFYRDYDRAIADFDATDELTPDVVDYPQSLSVDYMRGICYLMKEQFQQSLDYFDKHIAFETEVSGLDYIDRRVFLYQGIAHLGLQNDAAAVAAFDLGLRIAPKNANLLYWRAKMHFAQGDKYKTSLLLADARRELAMGNTNTRAYVEEFYTLYLDEINELEKSLE